MHRSRKSLFDSRIKPISLRKHISVPHDLKLGLVKCRIVYGKEINEITFSKYRRKIIKSLRIVTDNSIEYNHKYLDRSHINSLFNKRQDCDDIIIAKDGLLCDSSYSNIALLQDGKWYTPEKCLLQGTRRAQLLDQGKLIKKEISADSIGNYECVTLINAMIGLGEIRVVLNKKLAFIKV